MTIGLLPAAGMATRIYGLPKFLLPTPDRPLIDWHVHKMLEVGIAPTIISHEIMKPFLEKYEAALITVPRQKSTYVNDMSIFMNTGGSDMVFAMPDTFWTDDNVYNKLLKALETADMVVGVWLTSPNQRHKLGMVNFTPDYQVTEIIDKPPVTDLQYAWGVVAWRSLLWQCYDQRDTHLGIGINRAIQFEYSVKAVLMDGQYWDCGTPDEYFRLCALWAKG